MDGGGGAVLVIAIAFLAWQLSKFRKNISQFSRNSVHYGRALAGENEQRSPGHSYTIASRGPTHSLEAELQSAEIRWRQLIHAFPQLTEYQSTEKEIVVVRRQYTSLTEVEEMQADLAKSLTKYFQKQRLEITQLDWVKKLGDDFDALRHPEIAIANAAIYTFPFYLTWQRRHQWGVLPYATHTRLGVVVRKDHVNFDQLAKSELQYSANLQDAKKHGLLNWLSSPHYVSWLADLITAAGSTPVDISATTDLATQPNWHKSSTVFSVGAYLHKELLPLACAVLANPDVSVKFTKYAQEIDQPSILSSSGLLYAKNNWPQNSAVFIDLALVSNVAPTEDVQIKDVLATAQIYDYAWLVRMKANLDAIESSKLILFRLPHCVYVPIGIGYSILALSMLAKNRTEIHSFLQAAGESLMPIKAQLSDIGIELDERFWNQPNQTLTS